MILNSFFEDVFENEEMFTQILCVKYVALSLHPATPLKMGKTPVLIKNHVAASTRLF